MPHEEARPTNLFPNSHPPPAPSAAQKLTGLSLELRRALHLAAVLERPLAGTGALSEGSGATEGPGGSVVVDADDADVVGAADGALAGHALGHLDGDGVLAHLKQVSMEDKGKNDRE
jgi:hypothetical protein